MLDAYARTAPRGVRLGVFWTRRAFDHEPR